MVILGINSPDKNLVLEYSYLSNPARQQIEWTAICNDITVSISGIVKISDRLNRKMRGWTQDRIDAAVQRMVEFAIVRDAHEKSSNGIAGHDVWLKSRQAKFIGRPSQQLYTLARRLDLHIYREAM
nr:MAG TPA: hypothetical protein [Caudoviricetes sp.]